MLRLVEEDWAARLQARLREDVTANTDEPELFLEPQERPGDGLLFGPYGHSPVSGLHFDAPEDTAAS